MLRTISMKAKERRQRKRRKKTRKHWDRTCIDRRPMSVNFFIVTAAITLVFIMQIISNCYLTSLNACAKIKRRIHARSGTHEMRLPDDSISIFRKVNYMHFRSVSYSPSAIYSSKRNDTQRQTVSLSTCFQLWIGSVVSVHLTTNDHDHDHGIAKQKKKHNKRKYSLSFSRNSMWYSGSSLLWRFTIVRYGSIISCRCLYAIVIVLHEFSTNPRILSLQCCAAFDVTVARTTIPINKTVFICKRTFEKEDKAREKKELESITSLEATHAKTDDQYQRQFNEFRAR